MNKFLNLFNNFNQNHFHKIDRWWVGYLLSAFGFGITIAAFYPGYMSPDSISNLTQGREGLFYDINSPVMSCLWGVLDRIYAGPALMLIFHNLIFWSGCAIFWKATRNESAKLGLALVLLGFMPQILSQLSTIWKDVGLTVSLFIVAALLYSSARNKSKGFLFVTPVFLFYAYAMRLNAFPAIIPFVIWTAIIFQSNFNFNYTKRRNALFVAIFSGICFAALSLGVNYVNDRLTEGRTVYPLQQVFLYDLAAISKGRDESVFPEHVLNQRNFSLEKVKAEYNVRSINRLIYGDPPIIELSKDPNEIAALQNKWFEAVMDNKGLYLSHRYFVFAQLVGFTRQTVSNTFWDSGFAENPVEFRAEPNLLNKALTKYFNLLKKWGPFHGFLWLTPCFFYMYKAIRNKFGGDWQIVFFLSLSAVMYIIAYFPTTPSTEFRYILWSVLASAVAFVFAGRLLIKEWLAKKGFGEA